MVPTPHNSANKDEMAKTVLMPGDPMRSKYIAETFLENAKLVNNIRGAQGYTGVWKGKPVSVMSSGIGIPSISVYAYELFNFYDTDRIIRIGTIGSLSNDLTVGSVVMAETAFTDCDFYHHFNVPENYVAHSTPALIEKAEAAAKMLNIPYSKGDILTSVVYYSEQPGYLDYWIGKGVLGIEMEAAALYANAFQAGKEALSLFTVSNNILTHEEMDPMLRERHLNEMIEIALNCV